MGQLHSFSSGGATKNVDATGIHLVTFSGIRYGIPQQDHIQYRNTRRNFHTILVNSTW